MLALWAPATVVLAEDPASSKSDWILGPGGQWQPIREPATQPATEPILDQVEQMLASKQAEAAHKLCLAWVRSHQKDPSRDRGVYLLGMANFMAGDRIEAFYEFDEILDIYPNSRYFYPSLEQQYVIADQFLKGYKLKFMGIPMVGATVEGTEILYRIQTRAPGSPLAEKALLRVADYYYARSDYDYAADAYAAYLKSYPKSPYVPAVKLRLAFSSLAQFRGVKFDATPIIDARQQLIDFARQHPDMAEEQNVAAIVSRIDASLAIKFLETGKFYIRTHEPRSAAYYFKILIATYPDAPEAAEAKERMEKLPPEALKTPEPPATRPAAPTTQPTETR